MILTPHVLVGAAIGAKTHNLGLIIILGFLSHLIMDKLPHWDYVNHGIRDFKKTKNFKALFFDLFKIAVDGFIGFLITFLIVWQTHQLNNWSFILLGIFFSILPDIILFSSHLLGIKHFSEKYIAFHKSFFHYKKEKEGEITFLNITTEILAIIISIIIFFS